VTAESIKEGVNINVANGMINDPGIGTSQLGKLDNAADARAKGNCKRASNLYLTPHIIAVKGRRGQPAQQRLSMHWTESES